MNKFLNILKRYIPTKLFKSLQPAYHFSMAWFAALIYKNPSEKLIVIGVTGTTGKTTTTYVIAKMLKNLGFKVGYTSTALFDDGEREWLNDKKMTMPGRMFTQEMLAKMVKNGCQFAVVETTSEGVRQFRHRFINYDTLVFTGLYPEHIESHGGFENYKAAKGELFAHLKNCKTKYANDRKQVVKAEAGVKKLDLDRVKKTIIVNYDDDHAGFFLDFWAEEKIAYSKLVEAVDAKDVRLVKYGEVMPGGQGTKFFVDKQPIELQLLGEFNATNAMNAVCVALLLKTNLEIISQALGGVSGVPGRLEQISMGQEFGVIVDYAFEPVAVTKLYRTIENIAHEKIIHVLGATGGGRDTSRRPILGRIAGENADYVIVTDEDPYDENPEIIADQVIVGAEKAGKKLGVNLFKIMDRREAIVKALSLAEGGDVVFITGKGSEQAIARANGEMEVWDDRKVAKEELEKILAK